MHKDRWVRRALRLSVVFNLGGAFLFAFPSSALGRLAGLPSSVPRIYCALLAFFVALFGGAYAWLAAQRDIDRPLVAFSAIGKVGAFSTILTFWLAGQTPGRGVLAATGDLLFAGIFAWWLLVTREGDSASPHAAFAKHAG
jgi:hypothetical protein